MSDSARYKLVTGFHYNWGMLYQINISFNYQYPNTQYSLNRLFWF